MEVCNAKDMDLDHLFQSTDRKPNHSIKYKADHNCAACNLFGGQYQFKEGSSKKNGTNLMDLIVSSSTGSSSSPVI